MFPFTGIANEEELSTNELGEDEFYQADLMYGGVAVTYQEPFLVLDPQEYFGQTQALFMWFGGLRWYADRFDAADDTLFARTYPDLPNVVRRASVVGGLAWDSRSNEWNPKRGGLHDLSLEVGAPWVGASTSWARLNASFRFYQQVLTPKLVVASQLLFDAMVGEPPLFEQGFYGGLFPIEGFGGIMMGRGFFRRRRPASAP